MSETPLNVAVLEDALRHLDTGPDGEYSYTFVIDSIEAFARELADVYGGLAWQCDWTPDDLNPGPECPYCAGQMCARLDGLHCTHSLIERHGVAQ